MSKFNTDQTVLYRAWDDTHLMLKSWAGVITSTVFVAIIGYALHYIFGTIKGGLT